MYIIYIPLATLSRYVGKLRFSIHKSNCTSINKRRVHETFHYRFKMLALKYFKPRSSNNYFYNLFILQKKKSTLLKIGDKIKKIK